MTLLPRTALSRLRRTRPLDACARGLAHLVSRSDEGDATAAAAGTHGAEARSTVHGTGHDEPGPDPVVQANLAALNEALAEARRKAEEGLEQARSVVEGSDLETLARAVTAQTAAAVKSVTEITKLATRVVGDAADPDRGAHARV